MSQFSSWMIFLLINQLDLLLQGLQFLPQMLNPHGCDFYGIGLLFGLRSTWPNLSTA